MRDSTVVHLNKLVSTWLHNQTDKGENTVYSHIFEPVFFSHPYNFWSCVDFVIAKFPVLSIIPRIVRWLDIMNFKVTNFPVLRIVPCTPYYWNPCMHFFILHSQVSYLLVYDNILDTFWSFLRILQQPIFSSHNYYHTNHKHACNGYFPVWISWYTIEPLL